MDAGLEVAVARENGRCDQVLVDDGLLHLGVKRARVADAGGAAVTNGLEAEFVEVGLKSCLLEIRGDDTGTGSE